MCDVRKIRTIRHIINPFIKRQLYQEYYKFLIGGKKFRNLFDFHDSKRFWALFKKIK